MPQHASAGVTCCIRKWPPNLFARRRSPQGKIVPEGFSQQESSRGASLHFCFLKMGRCPKDRGVRCCFICDSLIWNDVFDWHGFAILPLSRLPQGGEAQTLLKYSLPFETQYFISVEKKTTQCPSSIWKRGKPTSR